MKRLLAVLALSVLATMPALCLLAPVPARAANIQNVDLGKNAEGLVCRRPHRPDHLLQHLLAGRLRL